MLQIILDALKSRHIFLTGGGGVGKSYTTKKITEHYTKLDKSVIILGSTGISAVGVGGVTVHSFFRFGICNNLNELASLDKARKQREKVKELYKTLQKTDLIVIDEISMVSGELFEMIYYRLKMGGFSGRLLLVGDFYQLPPVRGKLAPQPPANSLFTTGPYAFLSQAWHELDPLNIELMVSKRTHDHHFFSILSHLRVGRCTQEMARYLASRVVSEPPEGCTVLCGTNKEADAINIRRLSQLTTPPITLIADTQKLDDTLTDDALNRWVEALKSPQELTLKMGARVLFTQNKEGYFNGEQGEVVGFFSDEESGEVVQIEVRKDSGALVRVQRERIDMVGYEAGDGEVERRARASFTQFALRLAWAITIHKSQGMSLERFACNINNIFENGQLYVALSRAVRADGLFIIYSKNMDFSRYLQSTIKIDPLVEQFYSQRQFIKEGQNEAR